MALCSPCAAILAGDQLLEVTKRHPHHLSWPSFITSVDNECPICWRAFDSLTLRQQDCVRSLVGIGPRLTTSLRFRLSEKYRHRPHGQYVFIHLEALIHGRLDDYLSEGLIDEAAKTEIESLFSTTGGDIIRFAFLRLDPSHRWTAQVQGNSTSSSDALRWASSRLRECRSSHKSCSRRRGASDWFPSRLVDLGDLNVSSATDVFRIIRGSSLPPGVQYATLSHRWTANTPRLSTASLKSHMNGLSISNLPNTFQQAISVTRLLGLRYIWIDSLCIIQDGDDGHDWRREATQMSKIYMCCLVNISADQGSQYDALFAGRRIEWSYDLDLRLKLVSTDGITTATYSHVPHYNLEQLQSSNLSERGWVMQERLLSPAVLHFTRREIIWECCQMLASESLPRGLPDVDDFDMEAISRMIAIKHLDPVNDDHWRPMFEEMEKYDSTEKVLGTRLEERSMHYLLWWFLLRRYRRCDFSFETDRLAAISGVARYLASINGDQYVVGMWRKHLARELIWSSWPGEPWPKDMAYFAPSFSWASVRGFVDPSSHFAAPGQCLVEVVPVQMPSPPDRAGGYVQADEPIDESIFGPLTKPVVQIRVVGQLKAMLLCEYKGGWYMESLDFTVASQPRYRGPFKASMDYKTSESEKEEMQTRTFYYMPWISERVEEPITVSCLLLELYDASLRQFRRIGTCMADGSTGETLLRHQEHESTLPGYDGETGKHIIYLI